MDRNEQANIVMTFARNYIHTRYCDTKPHIEIQVLDVVKQLVFKKVNIEYWMFQIIEDALF